MNVPVHRSLRKAKLSACSALLTRFPSFICALVITLVCALTPSTANGQAVVQSVTSFGGGGSSASSYSIAKPAGLAVGDLMILSVGIESATSVTAAGFTQITSQANSSNFTLYVFRRIADAAAVSATNFRVSFGASKKYSVGLARITGHNGTTPIVTFASATGSGAAVTSPTITTTAANQLVLSFHGVKKTASFSGGPGTKRYDVSADPPSHALYSYVQAAAGSTGTKTATSSQSEVWAAIQVAIASAPAATPAISSSGTLAAVNTTFPNASASPTSFNVSGANMTAGILVTAPANFQVSNAIGGTYASTVTIGAAGTISSTPVFVRLAANTPAGTYSGNLVLSSTGATSVNVATVSSVVIKATPTISTAPTASAITFGQTLASSTLSGGVGSVGGSFAFTTPATAPNAGTATQGVTFTPTDSANYNSATGTVSVTVNKATPTISTAPTASAITFGQTLASSTLSGGSASTAGTFTFTTPATAPNAGTASQSVTFTPSNTTNFNTTTTTVSVTVNKATPTISTAPTASPITYGQTLADSTLTGGSASTAGTFAFTTPATAPNAGTASQGVTFTPTDAANYNTAAGTVNVSVAPRNLTITGLTGDNKPVDGTTNATASGTAALQGVQAGDSVSLAGTPIFTFASAGVGTGITITTTGYTLAGDNAGNYTLTQPLLSANILDVPALVTGTAGSITRTTAQISGNEITSDGGSAITERGVVFSTNAQPTVSDTKVAVAGELGAFAASLSGLTGGTTYYVRAYATNALTTVYGSAISFTANAKPVFSGMALTVNKGGSLQIIESKLRPRITDAESNPVTITGAAGTSQHGGTVTRSNRVITYTSSASFSGNDTFAVTVDDGFGASNITLTVAVTEDPLFTSAANAPRITTLDGGAVRVTFNGIPGRTYGIQRSTTMAGGTWTQISAVTAGSNSVVTFDDLNPPTTSAFYRIAFPAQ